MGQKMKYFFNLKKLYFITVIEKERKAPTAKNKKNVYSLNLWSRAEENNHRYTFCFVKFSKQSINYNFYICRIVDFDNLAEHGKAFEEVDKEIPTLFNKARFFKHQVGFSVIAVQKINNQKMS
jgi:hypothetical protein